MSSRFAFVTLVAVGVAAVACSKPEEKKEVVKVSCQDSIKSLGDKAKDGFVAQCPASCMAGALWGTDTYTTDSSICTAGMHAGVIKDSGGEVKVSFAGGLKSYNGSQRNGVTSSDWGPFEKSFTVK